MTSVKDAERMGRPSTSERDEMWIVRRNKTSRTKELPFVEVLICWEFYLGQFGSRGMRFSHHNVTSHSTLPLCGLLAKNKIASCFSPKFNVASKGRRLNGITMIQAISNIANFKPCAAEKVLKVGATTRLAVRSPREITPKKNNND